jgi:hypothetical protein
MKTDLYEELFRKNVVVTIDSLKLATGRPRESILRDLKSIGYYSSYNVRGKFYTLASTPVFDDFGLWKYRDAYFSVRRTLLDTAEYLVVDSDAGRTHDELRGILGIGIQNSLHQLTMAGKIVRRQVGAQYVYFGIDAVGGQLERRNALPVEPIVRKTIKVPYTKGYPDLDPAIIIDILIAALRGHDTDSAAYANLHNAGSPVTEQQVTAVFRYYGIGKKNSPTQN